MRSKGPGGNDRVTIVSRRAQLWGREGTIERASNESGSKNDDTRKAHPVLAAGRGSSSPSRSTRLVAALIGCCATRSVTSVLDFLAAPQCLNAPRPPGARAAQRCGRASVHTRAFQDLAIVALNIDVRTGVNSVGPCTEREEGNRQTYGRNTSVAPRAVGNDRKLVTRIPTARPARLQSITAPVG